MKTIGLLILFVTLTFQSYALDGLLIQTIDYSLHDKWTKTISSSVPTISTCTKVFKKQYFFLTAIVGGYSINDLGIANVDYTIKITKPDKTIYTSQEQLPILNRKVADNKNLQMSDAVLKICFEEPDAFGKYKIDVEINDRISGQSKSIHSIIELVDMPKYKKFKVKDDVAFSDWVSNYYLKQKPESALMNYIYYSQSKLSDNESGFWPVFSEFIEIYKNNTFLLPQLFQFFKNQDDKTRIYLIYLLHYSELGTPDFFNGLSEMDTKTYSQIKDLKISDIYGKITDAQQLDMLWATFMAGGSYQPILKLIQTLEYNKYNGFLEKYKDSGKTEEDRQNAINNAIYNSLIWSLKSNCKQHPLVKAYCEWAMENENLSTIQKDELKLIL